MSYEFSVSKDFPNGIDCGQFVKTVVNDIRIDPIFKLTRLYDDQFIIEFLTPLSEEELNVLREIVNTHVPVPEYIYDKVFADLTIKQEISKTVFQSSARLTYPGSSRTTLKYFKISGNISRGPESGASYSVRLYDTTNNRTIFLGTLTNTETQETRYELTQENLSNDEANWEIHFKTSPETIAVVDYVVIY